VAPGYRREFNTPKQTVAEATRTTNYEGGEAFEPADPRLTLCKRTINQLLEGSFYETDDEQLAAVVRRFDAAANDNPEFVLKLAAYARQELYLRDIPQVLLVLTANDDRFNIERALCVRERCGAAFNADVNGRRISVSTSTRVILSLHPT
jgi:hypothetical protein